MNASSRGVLPASLHLANVGAWPADALPTSGYWTGRCVLQRRRADDRTNTSTADCRELIRISGRVHGQGLAMAST